MRSVGLLCGASCASSSLWLPVARNWAVLILRVRDRPCVEYMRLGLTKMHDVNVLVVQQPRRTMRAHQPAPRPSPGGSTRPEVFWLAPEGRRQPGLVAGAARGPCMVGAYWVLEL